MPVRLEVPIGGRNEKMRKQRLTANTRAKTQEIPPTGRTFEFESRYESRAVSGGLNEPNLFGMQKPLFAASREAFGRDTAEDLRGGKLENWQRQHQWTSDLSKSVPDPQAVSSLTQCYSNPDLVRSMTSKRLC